MDNSSKVTRTDIEIDQSMTLDVCCEPDCGISVMVEKEMKCMRRQTRCPACLMRFKIGRK